MNRNTDLEVILYKLHDILYAGQSSKSEKLITYSEVYTYVYL